MNLDAVRRFVVDGHLMSGADFDRFRSDWLASGDGPDDAEPFVRYLCRENRLTDFQAAAVLAGIPGPYRLGPYEVLDFVTAGRLGNVFHAVHIEFRQPVGLKIFPAALSRNPERLTQLGREARVGVLVDNLHVVKTFQVGKIGEVPFIALEELQGETLQQRLDREGRLPYPEVCRLLSQAALGLDYLHSEEIIHRDICPANLWVTNGGIVKILEFGAARDALSYLDSLGEDEVTAADRSTVDDPLGHYAYMSAEQARTPESANVASDLYSLGCTLYHALTGHVPFPDTNPVRQMLRHASEAPRPLDEFAVEIPDELQAIVSRLLAKDPLARYGSAEEVATALAAFEPEARSFEPEAVNAEFVDWLQSGARIEDVTEMEFDPEFQKFVDWVSEESLPQL